MKAIAIVTPSLKAGGMERVASELANNLSRKDSLKVILISLTNDDKFYKLDTDVVYYSCQYKVSENATLKAMRYIKELRKAFRKYRPDVVLSFGDRYNNFTLLASLGFAHHKFISNRQNPNLSNGRVVDFLNLLTYKLSDGMIAQTHHAKRVIKEKYSLQNVEVIPNPIRVNTEPLGHRDNVILNVGRFGDAKNQFDLVEMFSEISERLKWRVNFFGEGRKKVQTMKVIEDLGLQNCITVNPFKKEISDEYSRSAIFAFVSRSEGFPNALAEAMAHGCACIAYDCVAGPSDLIDDGVNGFLVPEGDRIQYKKKLSLLMKDEGLRKRLGMEAKNKMRLFDSERIVEKYLNFIVKEDLRIKEKHAN